MAGPLNFRCVLFVTERVGILSRSLVRWFRHGKDARNVQSHCSTSYKGRQHMHPAQNMKRDKRSTHKLR